MEQSYEHETTNTIEEQINKENINNYTEEQSENLKNKQNSVIQLKLFNKEKYHSTKETMKYTQYSQFSYVL